MPEYFILTTELHDHMHLTLSPILKRLCSFITDNPLEVERDDINFVDD